MKYITSEILSEVLNLEKDNFKEENLEFGKPYRLLHVDSWVESGLRLDDIKIATTNMQLRKKKDSGSSMILLLNMVLGTGFMNLNNLETPIYQQAKDYELSGERKKAQKLYIRASMYYKVAAFPGIFRKWNPTYRESIAVYKKCLTAYEKYGQYLASPT